METYIILITALVIISLCAIIIKIFLFLTFYSIKWVKIDSVLRYRYNLVDEELVGYRKRYKELLDLNNERMLFKFIEKIESLGYNEFDYDPLRSNMENDLIIEYPSFVLDDFSADQYCYNHLLKLNDNIDKSIIDSAIKLYYKQKEKQHLADS